MVKKWLTTVSIRIKFIARCHVKDMNVGRYLCKPGLFMRGNTKTGAEFESDLAQNQPGLNLSAR